MQSISQQQHLQLISCSKGLKDKLNELREINARIQDLCTSAKALLQNFGNEDARFRIEIKAEIESLEQFKGELLSIEALRERLRVEKEKVHDYENRIETVRNKIERHELEEARNRRMSCELSVSRTALLCSNTTFQGERGCSGGSLRLL